MTLKEPMHRFLLIADEPEQATLLAEQLQSGFQDPYELIHVPSLSIAAQYLSESEWSLVLLDLGLYESNGIETLYDFNKRFGGKHSVLALTAGRDDLIGELAIKNGALDFLDRRHVDDKSLARSIRYALERKRHLEALQRAKRDLAEFARHAAHDLKAPLRTIASFTRLLKEELSSDQLTPRAREYFRFIDKGSERSIRLVNDLLAFSEYGTRAIKKEQVSLSAVLENAKHMLTREIQQSAAVIRFGDLPELEVDLGLMTQVFQNLILNAIKYRKADTPPVIEIRYERAEFANLISFTDNGEGIEAKYFDLIFKPFKRLHSEDEIAGSGLGLSICSRIVEAHGGRLHVDSEYGVGSTFRIELPSEAFAWSI